MGLANKQALYNDAKVYVQVRADFFPDGRLRPLQITWRDGRKFPIDRVTQCRRAAAFRAGGCGIRYTCIIGGNPCHLFYEEGGRWFVEAL